MLHWMALLPGVRPSLEASTACDPLDVLHLAWWCLQFTPRVAVLGEAVVLEIQGSERLFGGHIVLRRRIAREAQTQGVMVWAHASTALAALALARYVSVSGHTDQTLARHDGIEDDDEAGAGCHAWLDPLPLSVLPGVAEHDATLARLGCQTLAQVRSLPRGGLSRRFGAGLLQSLDQAYGLRPQAFEWVVLPPVFDVRLELPSRVDMAPALLFAANRLLQHMCAWLAGRQSGVLAFTLHWVHDGQRRDCPREGEWTIRLASPSRDMARLGRLLAEHLQRIPLLAPVGEIRLHAHEIEALPVSSLCLFHEHGDGQLTAQPDALITPAAQRAQREALLALLEKLSVRLGADRVLQARVQADHRLECAQTWLPAAQALSDQSGPALKAVPLADMPQPCWVLPEPMPLALSSDRAGLREHPVYQGKLNLLAGPHRIESGWWDTTSGHELVTRDYYLASSEHAGLLWVFKARHAPDDQRSPWYLHGFFA